MFCGVGGLPIDDDLPRPLPAAPRRCCSRKPNKNPYSGRGLDKFSAVLAELEARRENILKTIGPRGVATVRFMYTDSNWVPIIVRQRPQEGKEKAKKKKKNHNKKCSKVPLPSRQTSELCNKEVEKAVVAVAPISKKRAACERGPSGKPCRLPINYWLLAAMILLCLALFGRTFAICCTSVWWYIVPPAEAKRSDVERMAAKRTPATRTAENNRKDRRG